MAKKAAASELGAMEMALEHVFVAEGGYVNHPNDKGGPTNYGITQATLSSYLGRPATVDDMKDLKKDVAAKIYLKNYFEPMGLPLLKKNGPLLLALADQGVNRGRKTAVIQAQQVYNDTFGGKLTVDGILGPKSAEAFDDADALTFAREFTQASQSAYNSIVIRNNSQLVFLQGWTNRLHRLEDVIITGKVIPIREGELVVVPKPDNMESSNLGPYAWAKGEMGQKEIPGSKHNPRIVFYHGFTTLKATTDEVPWCASFMCAALEVNGIASTRSAAAISYAKWGKSVLGQHMPGDIAVLSRDGGNHVAFLAGPYKKGDKYIPLLGGNQSNQVKISNYDASRLLDIRRAV